MPRLRLALWLRLAGIGYGLGDWAMGHVPGARPDEACRERMWERIQGRVARGLRHGLTVAPLEDEDVTTGAAKILAEYVKVNAAHGMCGMVSRSDTDEGQDA